MTKREYLALLLRSAADGTFPAVVVVQAEHGPGRLRCMYRTPDRRRRCAVGVLIPPEKYRPEVEDMNPVYALKVCGVPLPEGITPEDLVCIRMRHDRLAREGDWDAAEFRASLLRLDCFRGFAGATPEAPL